MINFKLKNLSFFLAILLIVLMYNTPNSLKDFSNQFLGKIILVLFLAYFAIFCDMACAIIFSMIIIVLLHDSREGYFSGGLAQVIQQTSETADKMEGKMKNEGFKESHGGKESHGKKKSKKDADDKEGFIGLNNMKEVNDKLHKYLGFSITELDRQMKTSSEKNTQNATKDLE